MIEEEYPQQRFMWLRRWFWKSQTLSKKYGLYFYLAYSSWSFRLGTGRNVYCFGTKSHRVPTSAFGTLPMKMEADETAMIADEGPQELFDVAQYRADLVNMQLRLWDQITPQEKEWLQLAVDTLPFRRD